MVQIVMLKNDTSDICENVLHFLSEWSRLVLSELQGPQNAVISMGDQKKCEPCNLDSSTGMDGKTAREMTTCFIKFHKVLFTTTLEWENYCDNTIHSPMTNQWCNTTK